MSRLIDIDDSRNCYIGMDGEYEKWNIDPGVIAEAQPQRKTDEWCTDCREYDQERHCCPRFNRVIRQTLSEQRKTGHWLKISPAGIYECSECGKNVMTADIDAYEFCHGCGAKMEVEHEVD